MNKQLEQTIKAFGYIFIAATLFAIIFSIFNDPSRAPEYVVQYIVVFVLSIIVTTTPTYVALSQNSHKNFYGYGVPLIVFFVPLPFLVYNYYTCVGKFCQLLPMLVGIGLGALSGVYFITYTLAHLSQKFGMKFAVTAIVAEVIVLIGACWYYMLQY